MTTRRGFLRGVASLLAAPAIVRVGSLMPVKAIEPSEIELVRAWMSRPMILLYHQEFIEAFEQRYSVLRVAHVEGLQ